MWLESQVHVRYGPAVLPMYIPATDGVHTTFDVREVGLHASRTDETLGHHVSPCSKFVSRRSFGPSWNDGHLLTSRSWWRLRSPAGLWLAPVAIVQGQ